MKTKYNRFAFIPFHCTECHRIIWLEPYRKSRCVDKPATMLPRNY